MAFPHPQSGNDHDGNENKPGLEGVVWNFVEGAIDISKDRNAEDEVNPAKNRSYGALAHEVDSLVCRTVSFPNGHHSFHPKL